MLAVLLDIEGTTTPISFVHDVLFPYSRKRLSTFLEEHRLRPDVIADLALLQEEYNYDRSSGLYPPSLVEPYVNWLIDQDRKSPALKSLQGRIWKQGYEDGSLQAPIFPDVLTAMERWRRASVSINIFSSGSVLAQQLLFAHTNAGDLSGFISKYFDTAVGKKIEPRSYQKIAGELGLDANQISFVSDVALELEAARGAGMNTALCIRPGNLEQDGVFQHRIIRSFDEID